MVRTMIVGILLVLMVTLAACSVPGLSQGSSEADTPTEPIALPQPIQLSVGTLMLEETPHPVTAEQAEELLRLKNLVFDASVAANSTADTQGIINEANNAFLKLWSKVLIENWRKEYNQIRPHSALGYRPPAPETTPLHISPPLTLEVVQ